MKIKKFSPNVGSYRIVIIDERGEQWSGIDSHITDPIHRLTSCLTGSGYVRRTVRFLGNSLRKCIMYHLYRIRTLVLAVCVDPAGSSLNISPSRS